MRAVVHWTAKELLSRKGFFDGTFATSYGRRHGRIIAPEECSSADVQSLAKASFVIGDDYPDYVLCLVYLLSCRRLQYIVLHDPEIGSHNVDCLDSFVYKGRPYVVDTTSRGTWFGTLPPELQDIFENTSVAVEIDSD